MKPKFYGVFSDFWGISCFTAPAAEPGACDWWQMQEMFPDVFSSVVHPPKDFRRCLSARYGFHVMKGCKHGAACIRFAIASSYDCTGPQLSHCYRFGRPASSSPSSMAEAVCFLGREY